MRSIIILFLWGLFLSPVFASPLMVDETQIKKNIQQTQEDKTVINQQAIVEALQSALNFIADGKSSSAKIREYQKAIEDFPALTRQLLEEKNQAQENVSLISKKLSTNEFNKKLLQLNNHLIDLANQLQQEQEFTHAISDSLGLLPQQQTEACKALNKIEQQLQTLPMPSTPLEQAMATELQAEQVARRLKVDELDLAQLSANNRQELSRLRYEVLKKRYDRVDKQLKYLRNYINDIRQQEAAKALENTEILAEQGGTLPKYISNQLKTNRELSMALNQQAQLVDMIASQQSKAVAQIMQVRQALTTIREQAKWLDKSPALGETLRAQVSCLPEMTKPQQLDSDMAQLRVKRLQYEDMMNKLPLLLTNAKQDDGSKLIPAQMKILEEQLTIQRNLLNALLTGCDTQILELTKLKVTNSQLEEAMKEIKEASHRYLFWVADVNPITISFPLQVGHDLKKLLTIDTINQLTSALWIMLTSQETLLDLFCALLLLSFSISSRRHYHAFLERSSSKVGKVNQDHFALTLRTVFWSVLIALPLPVLWAVFGYGLRQAWPYPVAVAIGNGVSATVPVLWIFMVSAHFAKPKGLFIAHFIWPVQQVKRALRYYTLSIGMIVPLIMALITFDHYSDREFAGTIGRLCFILLCACLALVTSSLKRAGLPLYLNKHGSGDNGINCSLWNFMICAPIIAAMAACLGHLSTAQVLLARLETSVCIWFLLLIIYHIIRRWMFIQRRRIAFERAKQRRMDMLAQRARNEEDLSISQLNDVAAEVDEKVLDLDTISAQSLHLVRSILTLIALISVILLWSELQAFGFLENITLWDVTSTIQGEEHIQPITLGSILIAILVFIITTQMVRNLPALLELALLQHLDLTPGTGYAITTLTKYGLMLLGGLIGFSLIGIEWSKLQWLVAALGVGLGFGLQEIFANFISGLMILFEKPIRIGDTVTIRNLTGNITRINTRATTITDWDRKEIIVPNKAFITEQFVNWSLSDTVTRVVITIPAPAGANIRQITNILIQAASRCPLVLETPAPEAYLVDLQHGLPLFELRMHVAEMSHRMPLRHQVHEQIIDGYRNHGIELPFPPFQLRHEQIQHYNIKYSNRIMKSESGSI